MNISKLNLASSTPILSQLIWFLETLSDKKYRNQEASNEMLHPGISTPQLGTGLEDR